MVTQRFYTLSDVCEVLNISMSQARSLVRNGELPAIQVGGRGQWRVEISKLEQYIQDGYERQQEETQKNSTLQSATQS
ncbi:MAG: helix-turn-helix domain-containing protein [Rothia sp. (in: high G+C Gram-positive bacteria)]|nr:helix-turn-helix domain-containing protein [Rothia sp. (in: high G+C Gram-positive bacteria)]